MGNRLLTIFLALAIPLLAIRVLVVTQPVLMPLTMAAFVVFLLNATAEYYKKFKIPSAFLRYCLSFLTIGAFLCFPLYLTTLTIPEVVEAAPRYQENLDRIVEEIDNILPGEFSLKELTDQVSLTTIITSLAAALGSFASELVVILIYIGFILAEQSSLRNRLLGLVVDEKKREQFKRIANSGGEKVQIYLRVKTLCSLMVAVITFVALSIFNVDFAAFWATICFFLNFIPSIGSLLGILLPTLMTLVQHGFGLPLLFVFLVVGVGQLVLSNVTEPKMMGTSLNTSPLAIIIALFTFGAIWGIVGAFLSVPLLVAIMIISAEFEETRPIAVMLSADGEV